MVGTLLLGYSFAVSTEAETVQKHAQPPIHRQHFHRMVHILLNKFQRYWKYLLIFYCSLFIMSIMYLCIVGCFSRVLSFSLFFTLSLLLLSIFFFSLFVICVYLLSIFSLGPSYHFSLCFCHGSMNLLGTQPVLLCSSNLIKAIIMCIEFTFTLCIQKLFY